jgi:hypothetical protein
MNKKNHRAKEHKLQRVGVALTEFRNMPDWKERVAKRARVTLNFITNAIRRGELQIPAKPKWEA